MKNLEALKREIVSAVDARRSELSKLSLKIHANPELGLREVKASGWLTDYLRKNDFTVESGICELPTAFRASYGNGSPAIALLAEYDALPKIGHACGHNIIGTASAGAAVAARQAVDQLGGTVLVIGTPGEESGGGKAIMAKRGAFDNLDAAMLVHPDIYDTAATRTLACQPLEVEFFGKAAHAAAHPEAGINALDAMLLSFAAINSLRQHIRTTARIHGIITDGGEAANIVPAHTAASFLVRAGDEAYLEELKQRVLNCFTGAATATGARLVHRWGDNAYALLLNNPTLAQLFRQNMQSLGRRVHLSEPVQAFGSSDMGNVSQVVPAIHPTVAIAPADVPLHSVAFAAAAASEAGIRGLMDAAKALAMTVADLAANPEIVGQIREEFRKSK
ncbi:MAG: M20 family metallopeptidase [Chloroflexota bacterium]|nr:M20 family metallopeptidase [Chloroflexota bacterium]